MWPPREGEPPSPILTHGCALVGWERLRAGGYAAAMTFDRRSMAALAAASLIVLGSSLAAQQRWPAGHARAGLVQDPARSTPYAEDADHVANRLFRRLWTATLAPAEVAQVVPGEAELPFVEGWVHKKRKGTDGDRGTFGGDGRMLPLEGLDADAAKALRADLLALDDKAVAALQTDAALAVHLQNDFLRAAQRLLDVERNLDLVPLLRDCALRLGLSTEHLAKLPDTLRLAARGDAPALPANELPEQLGGTAAGFREITRRSTRLFDAEHTLLWSRVFLRHPDGEAALAAMLPKPGDKPAKGEGPTTPIGFRAVLVQGLVAIDAAGVPRATPLVVDVRTQTLQNREPLGAGNRTFTHDGLDFGIWQLQREGLRRAEPQQFFRAVRADDLDLFRDYGTAKLTTYRGQCSLCHRVSDSPEPELAGFPVLRAHVQATFAVNGDERLRLAEQQVGKLLASLRAAN